MRGQAPRRVLIDTDPGLDDAVAILYALAEPSLAVEAVTAVAGNIGIATTSRTVAGLLSVMGRADIPHAAGAAAPLAGAGRSEIAIHGADGLGGVVLLSGTPPDSRGAVALMADRLQAAPDGSISVLALGPLTNLALLARDEPAAYGRISRIIAMGGTIEEPGNAGPLAEFNMAADPLAARIVLGGGVPVTLIPLDVTRRVRATPEDLARLGSAGTVAARYAADLILAYFAGRTDRRSRPLHDPCVMLMAAAPALFGTERLRLSVDCDTHPGRLMQGPDGAPVDVALRIDAGAALDRLWQGLGTSR